MEASGTASLDTASTAMEAAPERVGQRATSFRGELGPRRTSLTEQTVKATMESLEREESYAQKRVLAVTRGRSFMICSALVIAIHVLYLGIETDFDDARGAPDGVWFYLELVFTLVFIVELLLRLFAERTQFFYDRWNVFDFALVLISCLDTFIIGQIENDSVRSFGFLNILRGLRLLRLARIVRLLKFFRTLWMLIIGVLDAMRTLVWAWVLITVIIFVFAVFMTRVLGREHADLSDDLRQQFGRVEYSMFTLFQIMTLEGWPSIARNAMKYEPWIWIVFILFLFSTTFSLMNVIVSVIVESTLDQAKDRKAENMKRQEAELKNAGDKVTEVFNASDGNGDGVVTKEEFIEAMGRKDVLAYLTEVGIDARQAENLFDILDYDDSGSLDSSEFRKGILKMRGEAQAQDVLAVQCSLWRYELRVREDLQALCRRVHIDMAKVDEEIDLLHQDVSLLGERMDFCTGSLQDTQETLKLDEVSSQRNDTYDAVDEL